MLFLANFYQQFIGRFRMEKRNHLAICAFFGGLMDQSKALTDKPFDFLLDVVGLERNMMKPLAFGGKELGNWRVGIAGF